MPPLRDLALDVGHALAHALLQAVARRPQRVVLLFDAGQHAVEGHGEVLQLARPGGLNAQRIVPLLRHRPRRRHQPVDRPRQRGLERPARPKAATRTPP